VTMPAALCRACVIGENAGTSIGTKGVEISCLEIGPLYVARTRASLMLHSASRAATRSAATARAFFGFHDGVFEIRMKGERTIVRNRPRACRPKSLRDIVPIFRHLLAPPTTSNFTQIGWAV